MTTTRTLKKLGEIAQIKTGKKDANFGTDNGIYPFFTCGEKILKAPNYSFDTEAILVAGNGDVGACKYYKGKFEAYQRTYVVDGFDGNDPFYLFYYLNGFLGRKAKEQMLGSAIPYIKLGMLQNFEIPLPPLATQRAIVAKLDKAFAQIDKAITLTQDNIKSTEEFTKSVLDKIFEEGEWERVNLGDHVKIIGGGTPSKSKKEYYTNGTIRWATVRDMTQEIIEDTELKITEDGLRNSSSNIINENGIIIATRVGLGKVCYINKPTAINQDLKGLVPNKTLDKRFLLNYFKAVSHSIIGEGTGATVKGVKLDFIKSLKISLPPVPKQIEIVSYLDKIFSESSQLTSQYQAKLVELKALKASVLQGAFEGKLV